MNIHTIVPIVLSWALVLLGAGPARAHPDPLMPGPNLLSVRQPASAGGLVFQTGNNLAVFMPGRACLAALDQALCVEFEGGAGQPPRSAAGSGPAEVEADRGKSASPLREVRYAGLWPGIDLVYTGADDSAKATYQVAPGANPARIRLRYSLPAELLPDGSLRFALRSGGALIESAPLAWQDIGGRRVPVAVTFAISAGGQVGFRLGAFDRRYPLTIDPIYNWHTFYPGSAQALAVDGTGNIYLAGTSYVTWRGDEDQEPLNPFQGAYSNIVVIKLNANGGYLWHTFYGAPEAQDCGYGVDIDAEGNVYVAGFSADGWLGADNQLPRHPHAGAGITNLAVLKLDSNGAYKWHTFYGDLSAATTGGKVAVYGSSVYVAGRSNGNWQGDGDAEPLHAFSGGYDILVLKLNADGIYQWHTFYGSTAADYGEALAISGTGDVYAGGYSLASWQGAGDRPPRHAYTAAAASNLVVLKLSSSGAYQWHTFYGGSPATWHEVKSLATDARGDVYAVGYARESWQGDGGAQPLHPHSGLNDIALLKLDGNGTYQWHTFYGSSDQDAAWAVSVDRAGDIYVAGSSFASWQGDDDAEPLHAFSGPYPSYREQVMLKLTGAGVYQWHTFYGGGDAEDFLYGVAIDNAGSIVVAGESAGAWLGDGGALPIHGVAGTPSLAVLKMAGDVTGTVDPAAGGTLVYTDPQGLATTLEIPPLAVPGCVDLVYAPLISPTQTLDPGDQYARHAFLLHAYPCAGLRRVYLPLIVRRLPPVAGVAPPPAAAARPYRTLQPGDPIFSRPATITIEYSDADVAGLDEGTLQLVYWTGSAWDDMALTCQAPSGYTRDPAHNRISLTFCHMSQGALVGR